MAHITADRVLESTTTTGSGALSLAGALAGFRPFSAVCATSDTVWYSLWAVDGSGNPTGAYEAGLGTYSAANQLTRTTVLVSSNANNAVSLAAGTKYVAISALAPRTLQLDNGLGIPIPQTPNNAVPSAPASGFMEIFARSRAGRMLLNIIGPSGVDTPLQPALFGNSIFMWLPGTGTTLAINFGTSFTARNSGTGAAQAHPARASTNALTSLSRATFTTGTTATGSSGVQSSATIAWRGNATGLGGFFFFARVGIETFASDMQVLVGLSALNAALAGEPSAQNNTIALAKDSTDTNWQIVARDGSAVTKTNTTLAAAAGTVLDFSLFCPPNSSTITARLTNAVDGTVYVDNVALSANLPVNTTFLYAHAQVRSTTGATGKVLALNRLYLESDL